MDLLPNDLLANILGRLPPCSLAASRCVRKDWCALIDSRRLLRTDLLPLRLHGFYCISYALDPGTNFFSRQGTSIGHRLNFMGQDYCGVSVEFEDHCNGLILFYDMVVNPATRQWASLPPFQLSSDPDWDYHPRYSYSRFLAYDPIVSPSHYQVICFPPDSRTAEDESPLEIYILSSVKWRWERRYFVREGDAISMEINSKSSSAVYLRGLLYVLCTNNSTVRIAPSSDKYRMIAPPFENNAPPCKMNAYLGKSEKGVYFGLLTEDDGWPQFRAWVLDESQMETAEWVFLCNISLQAMVQNFPYVYMSYYDDAWNTPWTSYRLYRKLDTEEEEEPEEWDFDSGTILPEIKLGDDTERGSGALFLGFHPCKEIAFFLLPSSSRVVSCNLNTSRVQDLGIFDTRAFMLGKSLPYTPCWLGDITHQNN